MRMDMVKRAIIVVPVGVWPAETKYPVAVATGVRAHFSICLTWLQAAANHHGRQLSMRR
jgi:hypothetical protein